jgi:hypothetical protein
LDVSPTPKQQRKGNEDMKVSEIDFEGMKISELQQIISRAQEQIVRERRLESAKLGRALRRGQRISFKLGPRSGEKVGEVMKVNATTVMVATDSEGVRRVPITRENIKVLAQ